MFRIMTCKRRAGSSPVDSDRGGDGLQRWRLCGPDSGQGSWSYKRQPRSSVWRGQAGTAARVAWGLQSGQSSGRPDPGVGHVVGTRLPFFTHSPAAYDAGLVSDTFAMKDGVLGVRDVTSE